MYRIAEGSVLTGVAEFTDDEDGSPLIAKAGYPKVWLKDGSSKLMSLTAAPTATPGVWNVAVAIPELGLTDSKELALVWVLRTVDGDDKYRLEERVVVTPRQSTRLSEIVFIQGDADFELVLPTYLSSADAINIQLYAHNQPIWKAPVDISSFVTVRGETRTAFKIPAPNVDPTLQSMLLRVTHTPLGASAQTFTYKFWAITPQILLGMSHLEDFLNKSRIENVIPALEYTSGDLVSYLERGLYLFNTVGQISDFTGTNMQGVLFNGHVLCAQYYALSAQLLAEGSLAFNFSGQGVTLDVDRTPALEAALGRVEQQVNELVLPLKKQVARQNLLTGDGSNGNTRMHNPRSIGTLGLANAATTRFPYYGGAFIGRRS